MTSAVAADEVPRLAEGLEGFEVWDRKAHAPAHKSEQGAFVSVRVGGFVGISLICYKMWGEPEACRVMFDPERRRIGFKPCRTGEPGSYAFKKDSLKQVPLRNLFAYYDVQVSQTRRYHDPKVIDGVLVVDL
jgi:hypothetical protein